MCNGKMNGLRSADHGWAIFLLILSMTVNCIGLSWGLPSSERNQFYPADQTIYDRPKEHGVTLYWTTPYEPYHPDESFVLNALSNMSPKELDFNPRFFNYPTLFIYMTGGVLQMAKMAGLITIVNEKSYYVAHPEEMARIYKIGRIFAAAFSAVGVAALYYAMRFLEKERIVAIFGATILAITPAWVRESHFLLVNVPAATWMIFAFLMSAMAIRQEQKRYLWLAAICGGFATSTKYTSGAILLVLVYSWFHLAYQTKAWRSWGINLAMMVTLFAIAFSLGTPYLFGNWGQFLHDLQFEGGTKTGLPSLELLLNHFVYAQGTTLFIFTLIGTGILIYRWQRWQTNLVALFMLAGLAQQLISNADLMRYIIPALPPCAILASYALHHVVDQWRRYKWIKWGLAIVLLGPTLGYTINLLHQFNSADVRTTAAHWITKTIPHNTTIGIYDDIYFDLPPINQDHYPILRFKSQQTRLIPPVAVFNAMDDEFIENVAIPAYYQHQLFSQTLLPFWSWPLTKPPHDMNYTTTIINVYYQPEAILP